MSYGKTKAYISDQKRPIQFQLYIIIFQDFLPIRSDLVPPYEFLVNFLLKVLLTSHIMLPFIETKLPTFKSRD